MVELDSPSRIPCCAGGKHHRRRVPCAGAAEARTLIL